MRNDYSERSEYQLNEHDKSREQTEVRVDADGFSFGDIIAATIIACLCAPCFVVLFWLG